MRGGEVQLDDTNKSVMVALIPTDSSWCSIELPHMTLVYAGEYPDLSDGTFNAICKDALSIAMMTPPIMLSVTGVSVMGGGQDSKVDVLNLQPTTRLLAMRNAVEKWNASQFPFSPHCTIGPEGTAPTDLPSRLIFDTILVGWGNTYLSWPMQPVSL